MEELCNFENSDCPKGRPNTMNNYGVIRYDFVLHLFYLAINFDLYKYDIILQPKVLTPAIFEPTLTD